MGAGQQSCGNCAFWRSRLQDMQGKPSADYGADGACHRRAPIGEGFARVQANDWCGDWGLTSNPPIAEGDDMPREGWEER